MTERLEPICHQGDMHAILKLLGAERIDKRVSGSGAPISSTIHERYANKSGQEYELQTSNGGWSLFLVIPPQE